jgi:hypothetical protein
MTGTKLLGAIPGHALPDAFSFLPCHNRGPSLESKSASLNFNVANGSRVGIGPVSRMVGPGRLREGVPSLANQYSKTPWFQAVCTRIPTASLFLMPIKPPENVQATRSCLRARASPLVSSIWSSGDRSSCFDFGYALDLARERHQSSQPLGTFYLTQGNIAASARNSPHLDLWSMPPPRACGSNGVCRSNYTNAIRYSMEKAGEVAIAATRCLGENGYIDATFSSLVGF